MRIEISPTIKYEPENTGINRRADCAQWGVVIEHPDNDLNLVETIQLVSRALVAYGFSKENVAEYFEELQDAC